MAEYDNTNTGIISRNDRKETDKHPDIRGSINVEGTDYWLDGWKKERKSDGSPFYSLRVKRKDSLAAAPAPAKTKPVQDDDEIPF